MKEKVKGFFKKYGAWILLGIALFFLALGKSDFFDNSEPYIKKLDSINKVQVATEKQLAEERAQKEALLEQVNATEENYYKEYINEKKRRINAEKKLGAIGSLVFNKRYLDSIAEHITY